MFAEIFGAEQALFFRRHSSENHRTAGAGWGLRKYAGELEDNAASGGVVAGTVVDVVAGHVGADAEMVVVRGVHDGFVFQFGVGAGEHGEHVVR